MNAKSFATEMRELIEEVKANGTSTLYCDEIIGYLKRIEDSRNAEPTEIDIETNKARLQLAENTRKLQHQSDLEMFRSVITAGQNFIRISLLLNGGAAVALLAFIGHLATCSGSALCNGLKPIIHELANSLLMFALNALIIVIISGFTYLSQWFYAGSNQRGLKFNIGFILNIINIVLGIASYIVFLYAVFITVNSLSAL